MYSLSHIYGQALSFFLFSAPSKDFQKGGGGGQQKKKIIESSKKC